MLGEQNSFSSGPKELLLSSPEQEPSHLLAFEGCA